ncbi:MAG: T9SS type A sorting domain-containing protein [Bacteroidales bacterium]|nr:T9SS type A sorting domain-containing protein [Bacteroidales bacterium]
MKRLLLGLTCLCVTAGLLAQERIIAPNKLLIKAITTEYSRPVKDLGSQSQEMIPGTKSAGFFGECQVGTTQYDLMTNKAILNQLYMHDDGTIGVVWPLGFDPTGFNLRGTGYNYYDGSAWGPEPTVRIENTKTGWPSYTGYGEEGEIFVCHHMTDGLLYGIRETKGTGTWDIAIQGGPAGAVDISWPRVVTTGVNHDVIHFLSATYVTYMGQETCILYSRSQDGGTTWDIENHVFDELGSGYYFNTGADVYAFAEPRAGQMAFVVGDAWMDLALMKSSDEGDNWTKTVVWEHPYPFFDWNTTITDTFYCNDGSIAVALDNTGKAHISFGISRVMHLEVGTSYNYFPFVDGVVYWNEDMTTFGNDLHALDPYGHPNSQLVEDVNLVGWSQDVNNNGQLDLMADVMAYRTVGLSTMTGICVDDFNNVFLAYASTTETYDNGTYNYKHIWTRAKPAAGVWGDFMDLNTDLIHIFDECIYPHWSPNTDQNVYLYYMADATPGLALDDDHPYQENRMIFVDIGKYELGVFPSSVEQQTALDASVSQNYPNPCTDRTIVYVVLDQSATIGMEVRNTLGQLVYTIPPSEYAPGRNELSIDVNGLGSGIYFYTVSSGKESVTRKMVVD